MSVVLLVLIPSTVLLLQFYLQCVFYVQTSFYTSNTFEITTFHQTGKQYMIEVDINRVRNQINSDISQPRCLRQNDQKTLTIDTPPEVTHNGYTQYENDQQKESKKPYNCIVWHRKLVILSRRLNCCRLCGGAGDIGEVTVITQGCQATAIYVFTVELDFPYIQVEMAVFVTSDLK